MRRVAIALSVLFAGASACIDHPNIGKATGGATTGTSKNLLAPGTLCTSNPECASGVCGVDGTGRCCAMACATGDPTCGATTCDGTGACFYPSSAIICPASCVGSTLSQNSCNGAGACAAISSMPCPNNLACGDAGKCDTTCTSSSECAAGFVCNAGACVPPIEFGSCTENDDCDSQRCGIAGTGHCCSSACDSDAGPCGATDCYADTGACVYPGTGTGCGSAQTCDAGIQTDAAHCDGAGTCVPGAISIKCAPYTCGVNACRTTCDDDGGCAPGGSCDRFHHVCCAPGLAAGGSIAVDSVTGDDSVDCCGTDGNQPCQSITHAMQVIDLDQFRDVTITASVDGGPGFWPDGPPETYPIVLGWGVELYAPGLYFGLPSNLNVITFTIGPVSFNDHIGYASIVGGRSFFIEDGGDIAALIEDGGDPYSNDVAVVWPTNLTHIQVQTGSTLYLACAGIGGFGPDQQLTSPDSAGSDIDVAAGAQLILGADKAGRVTGTTELGSAHVGIECEGGEAGDVGCVVSDVPLNGVPSLLIDGFDDPAGSIAMGIAAGDNTTISLKSAPTIGAVLTRAAGIASFLKCIGIVSLDLFPAISQAVVLRGSASMTFENGTVECVLNQAFYLEASAQGVPSLTLSNTTIQNTGMAVYASAGTATISNSTIQYNGAGVEQDTDGTNIASIDLSGGAAGGRNVVACSDNVEGPAGATGVSVLNTTSQPLNASNVAWDTSTPDIFQCNAQLGNCSCESSSCTDSPGAEGMDAVEESTGTITTTGNTMSTLDCTPPDVAYPCTPGVVNAAMNCVFPWLICCPTTVDAGVCAVSCSGPG